MTWKKWIIGIVAFGLAAEVNQFFNPSPPQPDPNKAIIAEYKLNGIHLSAFKACDIQINGYSLTFTTKKGEVYFSQMPAEVCACHANQMVEVLKPDHFKANDAIVSAKKNKQPTLDAAALKSTELDVKSAALKLSSSLESCMEKVARKRTMQ